VAGLRHPEEQGGDSTKAHRGRGAQNGRSQPDLIRDQTPEQRTAGLRRHEGDREDGDPASLRVIPLFGG
jgi:hypothetical protein